MGLWIEEDRQHTLRQLEDVKNRFINRDSPAEDKNSHGLLTILCHLSRDAIMQKNILVKLGFYTPKERWCIADDVPHEDVYCFTDLGLDERIRMRGDQEALRELGMNKKEINALLEARGNRIWELLKTAEGQNILQQHYGFDGDSIFVALYPQNTNSSIGHITLRDNRTGIFPTENLHP